MRFSLSVSLGLLMALGITSGLSGQVKRSRAEAVPGLVASNTVGFGDIWIHSAMSVSAGSDHSLKLEPYGAAGLGLSQAMSIFAGAVPFERGFKSVIGKADAHLKLTLPNNDNLRLFGAALQGDLILSTEQDTLSVGQDTSRPAFTPRIGVTLAADIDLVKKFKTLPLKIYFNGSLFDNDRLIAQYRQQSYGAAVEYKGARNSGFAGFRLGLYQRKPKGVEKAVSGYPERIFSAMMGVRYRILARFSVLGSLHFPIAASVDEKRPVNYDKFAARFVLEFPIFYRETNAEAIRAMIFLETRKDTVAARTDPSEPVPGSEEALFADTPDGPVGSEQMKQLLTGDDAVSEREKSMKDKRKRIDEELKKIEELLE